MIPVFRFENHCWRVAAISPRGEVVVINLSPPAPLGAGEPSRLPQVQEALLVGAWSVDSSPGTGSKVLDVPTLGPPPDLHLPLVPGAVCACTLVGTGLTSTALLGIGHSSL